MEDNSFGARVPKIRKFRNWKVERAQKVVGGMARRRKWIRVKNFGNAGSPEILDEHRILHPYPGCIKPIRRDCPDEQARPWLCLNGIDRIDRQKVASKCEGTGIAHEGESCGR